MHKKKITVLTFKNKKEQPIHILELFSYFRSPRSIDITVSCSFVLRSFHIPRTSFCFSVRFYELHSWKNCDNVTAGVSLLPKNQSHRFKSTRKCIYVTMAFFLCRRAAEWSYIYGKFVDFIKIWKNNERYRSIAL